MRRCKVLGKLAGRTEQCVSRWFRHMERIEDDQLVKDLIWEVWGWKDGHERDGWTVWRMLNERRMSVKQGRMIVNDRSEWRAVVNARIMTRPWQSKQEFVIGGLAEQGRCGMKHYNCSSNSIVCSAWVGRRVTHSLMGDCRINYSFDWELGCFVVQWSARGL